MDAGRDASVVFDSAAERMERMHRLETAIADRRRRLAALEAEVDACPAPAVAQSAPLAAFQRPAEEAPALGPGPIAVDLLQQSLRMGDADEGLDVFAPPAKRFKREPGRATGPPEAVAEATGDAAYLILRVAAQGTCCAALTAGVHAGSVSCPAPCRAVLSAAQRQGHRLFLLITIDGTEHFQGLLRVTADVAASSPAADLPALWLVVAALAYDVACRALPGVGAVLRQQGLLLPLPAGLGAPLGDLVRQHGAPPPPGLRLPLTPRERELLARHAGLPPESGGGASPQSQAAGGAERTQPQRHRLGEAAPAPAAAAPLMPLGGVAPPGLVPLPALMGVPLGGPMLPFPMCMVATPQGLALAATAPQLQPPLTTAGLGTWSNPRPPDSNPAAAAESAPTPKADRARRLWVKGLQPGCGAVPLGAFFGSYGAVVDCDVVRDPASGEGTGWGYVVFDTPAAARVALGRTHTFRGVRLRLFPAAEVEADPHFMASIRSPATTVSM
eukprot:EG_transcript_8774